MAPIESRDLPGTLMNMASGGESQLGRLLRGDKVEEAAQVAYAVLTMAENVNERSKVMY